MEMGQRDGDFSDRFRRLWWTSHAWMPVRSPPFGSGSQGSSSGRSWKILRTMMMTSRAFLLLDMTTAFLWFGCMTRSQAIPMAARVDFACPRWACTMMARLEGSIMKAQMSARMSATHSFFRSTRTR